MWALAPAHTALARIACVHVRKALRTAPSIEEILSEHQSRRVHCPGFGSSSERWWGFTSDQAQTRCLWHHFGAVDGRKPFGETFSRLSGDLPSTMSLEPQDPTLRKITSMGAMGPDTCMFPDVHQNSACEISTLETTEMSRNGEMAR